MQNGSNQGARQVATPQPLSRGLIAAFALGAAALIFLSMRPQIGTYDKASYCWARRRCCTALSLIEIFILVTARRRFGLSQRSSKCSELVQP